MEFRNRTELGFDPIPEFSESILRAELIPQCGKLRNRMTALQWTFYQLENNHVCSVFKVVNDRWGGGTGCKHGGYYTCTDRYNPGHLVNHKWEDCFTVCPMLYKMSCLNLLCIE
jgi:hypothetical protein